MKPHHVVDAHADYINKVINDTTMKAFTGSWLAAEVEDGNLSQVDVEGSTWRYVQKLSSVTGLSVDSGVLILKAPGFPGIIIGIIQGDSTVATT